MRAWWVLHVDVGPTGGALVHVAPCGEYHRRTRLVLPTAEARRWEEALGLPGGLRGAAGVGYLARRADRPERSWTAPNATRARPLLLAEGPCRRPYGARPLEGASGERLAELLGLDLSGLLETFEARNLCPHVDPSPAEQRMGAERILADADRRRPLLVLGRAAELALVRVAGSVDALRRQWLSVDLLPHPSGRNVVLNTPGERQRLRLACVRALCASRGPGAPAEPPRGEAGFAAEVESIAADGFADAWSSLRRAGVVAPSRRPFHNWERVAGGEAERLERRFLGLGGRSLRAVLLGPPWRLGLDPSDGPWAVTGDAREDLAAAIVGAELTLSDSGWRDAWEARTAELEAIALTDRMLGGLRAGAPHGGAA